ncbi:MAG: AAA family ATPase [Oscillospiraceae bacterium]|nr:AAA family ATPase [Oscillospiraceae bacterium]
MTRIKTMVIMIGLQASGKSTFCKTCLSDYKYISLDILNTRNKEKNAVLSCLENNEDFVIDNTNPSVDDRKKYFEMIQDSDYKVIAYYMKSVLAECLLRNDKRTGKAKIPRMALASTSKKIDLPSYEEGFDEIYYVEMTDNGFNISDWKEN